MEEIIKNLNKSTLFRLSLGSKELFHSNFLAWLAEKSTAFNQEFLSFLGLPNYDIKPSKIYREKEHIDLWLEYEIQENQITKKVKVFVENKVKSIPYKSQLDSYAEKQESKKEKDVENYYILLSLYRPSFIVNNDCYKSPFGNWKYLSYTQLSEIIKKQKDIIVNDFEDNKYAAHIIDDYIKFINQLSSLGDYISDSVKNNRFYPSHLDSDWEMFQEIRMGDFYEKFRYAILAEHLKDELEKKHISENVIMGVNPGTCKEDELSNSQDAIYIDTGMSRSNGLIDIKMVLNQEQAPKSRKVIGIQIQDGKLRRLVETNTKGKAIDIVKDKTKIKDWFDGRDECFDAGTKVQKQIDNEDIRYHSFGESFVYRRKELDETCSLNELMDIIINEIKNIKEYVLS